VGGGGAIKNDATCPILHQYCPIIHFNIDFGLLTIKIACTF
jgi:hypothetical protein